MHWGLGTWDYCSPTSHHLLGSFFTSLSSTPGAFASPASPSHTCPMPPPIHGAQTYASSLSLPNYCCHPSPLARGWAQTQGGLRSGAHTLCYLGEGHSHRHLWTRNWLQNNWRMNGGGKPLASLPSGYILTWMLQSLGNYLSSLIAAVGRPVVL